MYSVTLMLQHMHMYAYTQLLYHGHTFIPYASSAHHNRDHALFPIVSNRNHATHVHVCYTCAPLRMRGKYAHAPLHIYRCRVDTIASALLCT